MYTVLLQYDNWYLFMSVHRSAEHFRILEETDSPQQEIEDGVYGLTGLLSTRPTASRTRNLIIRYAK